MDKYVDANLSLKRDWQKSQRIHHDMLQTISKSQSNFNKLALNQPKRFPLVKNKTQAFREKSIKASNQQLLAKLVKISERNDAKKYALAAKALPISPRKTPAQKAKAREIQLENKRLSKRLTFSTPSIDTRQIVSDFKRTQRLKDMLAKPHLTEKATKKRFDAFSSQLFYEITVPH